MSINLLPQELRPKSYAIKLSKTLKKTSFILVAVFLVFTVVVAGSYLVFRYQTSTSVKRQEEMKVKIKAQEQSEQKLVLIKDRLEKIKNVESSENVNAGVSTLESVNGIVDQDVVIKDVELKPSQAKVTFVAPASINLTRFLANLTNLNELVKIDLVKFEFVPEKGYEMTLSITK